MNFLLMVSLFVLELIDFVFMYLCKVPRKQSSNYLIECKNLLLAVMCLRSTFVVLYWFESFLSYIDYVGINLFCIYNCMTLDFNFQVFVVFWWKSIQVVKWLFMLLRCLHFEINSWEIYCMFLCNCYPYPKKIPTYSVIVIGKICFP
jgi:hypothetical protein